MAHDNKLRHYVALAKDLGVLGAVIGSVLLWMVKYYSLPGEVSAQAHEIQGTKEKITEHEKAQIARDGEINTHLAMIDETLKSYDKSLSSIDATLIRMWNRKGATQ